MRYEIYFCWRKRKEDRRGRRILAVTSQLLLLAVCMTQACCSDQWATLYLFPISRCHEEEERMLVLTSSGYSDWQMAPLEINFWICYAQYKARWQTGQEAASMCQNVIKYEFILEGSSGSFTSFNFRRNESGDLSTSFSLTFLVPLITVTKT